MTIQPVASLSPTLLARKGAARPAMRPQLQPLRAFQDNAARQLDDLGWNDMGNDVPDAPAQEAVPAEPQLLSPEPATTSPLLIQPVEADWDEPKGAEIVAIKPSVETVPARKPKATAVRETKSRRSALSDGRRAAFTLRLDSERHLKLRLACVTSNRSAQQLLIDALDRLIADLPDVAALASRVREGR